ncbi:MAG: class I SAM-dependent methyltransferase [Pedobacter sp.]
MSNDHRAGIIDQFSRQAIPFTRVPGHLDAIGLLMEMAQVTGTDSVLDVACGPGLVACEFAKQADHVTGIDITPAMIEQARNLQREKSLANLTWTVGDALPLPWPDNSFSLVITRYSFHHFLQPAAVIAEMVRVCMPGGRVLVADVAVEADKSEAYDRMERMRDPSHTHALTEEEFDALFQQAGLRDCRRTSYGVEIELESQLRASFPRSGDKQNLRRMITADIGLNRLGIKPCRENGMVVYTVPIAVLVGTKED